MTRGWAVAGLCLLSVLFDGGAFAQTVKYELVPNGSWLGPPGTNTSFFNAVRVDHVKNEVFGCNVQQKDVTPAIAQLSGRCNLYGTAVPPGQDLKTFLAGGLAPDRIAQDGQFWQIDQTTGATHFCIPSQSGAPNPPLNCIDITP
jgi:hypothetical protein